MQDRRKRHRGDPSLFLRLNSTISYTDEIGHRSALVGSTSNTCDRVHQVPGRRPISILLHSFPEDLKLII